ncbi:MAG: caspase family protein [Frankiales bacterium]|nr:caspase family protein [Frankiales bacterium]
MTRRAPSWLVEATAWSLGLVLLAGAGVALSFQEQTTRVVEEAALPVVVLPAAAPSPSPSPAAAVAPPAPQPAVVRQAPLRPAAQPALDVGSVLGPPPGPQNDIRPARTAAPANRYAFLAGITNYRNPTHDTIGSVNDVRLIRQSLLASGWLPDNIRIVTDEQATGRALRDGMAWLVAKGQPGTFTLFHYSGHVKQQGGTREALWPVDRDFVGDSEVAAVLSQVQGRMWVDIAGCEAGSFMDGLPSDRILVSASSKQTEKSYEYPEWNRSVWTGLLFDLGLSQGQADADGDGRTTVGEALRYATYYAQAITLGQRPHGRQTPQTAGAGDLGWTLADPPA